MAATASGASTTLALQRETTVGVVPGGNWNLFSVSRYSLGATQNFLENDQIGGGRDPVHRTRDVKDTTGQVTAPVDLTDSGLWFSLLLGDPVTTGTTNFSHSWISGEEAIRTYSIEERHTDLTPALYFLASGVRGGSFNFRMEPRGQPSMDIALVAQLIDNANTASAAGTPIRLGTFDRFSQFSNFIDIDPAGGTAWQPLAKQVAATFSYDNRLETVYYIGGGGQPGDINLQVPQLQGEFTARLADGVLFGLADAGTKFAMRMGWYRGASVSAATQALVFTFPSIEIGTGAPRVEGAAGVESTFQWSAGKPSGGEAMTVLLKNQYDGDEYQFTGP